MTQTIPQRLRTTLDLLARAEAGERIRQAGSVGEGELGVELEQRREDEAAAAHLGMGQRETVADELEVPEQEQVDV